jgi:hypothetical protein
MENMVDKQILNSFWSTKTVVGVCLQLENTHTL